MTLAEGGLGVHRVVATCTPAPFQRSNAGKISLGLLMRWPAPMRKPQAEIAAHRASPDRSTTEADLGRLFPASAHRQLYSILLVNSICEDRSPNVIPALLALHRLGAVALPMLQNLMAERWRFPCAMDRLVS